MHRAQFDSFLSELEKLSGISSAARVAPTPSLNTQPGQPDNQQQQQPAPTKPKGILQRNLGGGAAILPGIGAAITTGALLRNPSNAGKFLSTLKEVATKPVASIKRGLNTGANFVGQNADEFSQGAARSKRVELMNEAFQDALGGTATQYDVLSEGAGAARRGGWGSAGTRSSGGLTGLLKGEAPFAPSDDLKSAIQGVVERQSRGDMVPEEELMSIYRKIGDEAGQQGVKLRGGLTTYLPGERAMEIAQIGGTGLIHAAPSTDEEGNRRGIAERLARGVTAAGVSAGGAHMFSGRNLGLSKRNLITGDPRSFLSQKLIVPGAAAMALSPVEGIAADATGSAAAVLDRAFGQKKDNES